MNRNISVDFLRIIASFAVIIIHVDVQIWSANHFDTSWWISNIFDSVSRWCVPVFFMLSGMFLLNPKRQESITFFLRKRFSKVLIPFLIFGLGYTIFNIFVYDTPYTFSKVVKDFITGNVEFHFWFIYVILSFYLLTPILRKITADRVTTRYFIILWLVAVSLERYLSFFHEIKIGLTIQYITGYIGFFLIGYYLKDTKLNIKQKYINLVVFIISVLVTAFGHYLLNVDTIEKNTYFTGYFSPNIIVMSISIFLIFINMNINFNSNINRLIIKVSELTFEIYLIHIMIRKIIYEGHFGFSLQPIDFNPLFSIPLISIIIFILSMGVAVVYKFIFKRIFPGI